MSSETSTPDSASWAMDARIDTTVAHPARVYDFWLGGKDHFASDREAGAKVMEHNPGIVPGVRANRAFLVRSVRYVVAEAGIRQILDIGTGLPSANNVHEVAQSIDPGVRVVYVDNDPIVLVHAHALLTGEPGTVNYLDADLRNPAAILAQAERTLDLTQPVALMLLMTMQFIPDDADPYGIVRTLLDALPSGSYLALSHPRAEDAGGQEGTRQYNERVSTPMTRRDKAAITRFFDGLELVEPGVVTMPEWRPDAETEPPPVPVPALCGVARKP